MNGLAVKLLWPPERDADAPPPRDSVECGAATPENDARPVPNNNSVTQRAPKRCSSTALTAIDGDDDAAIPKDVLPRQK